MQQLSASWLAGNAHCNRLPANVADLAATAAEREDVVHPYAPTCGGGKVNLFEQLA
jgi:hypothetical protein